MMNTDGLEGGPVLAPKPKTIPRSEGVPQNMVQDALRDTRDNVGMSMPRDYARQVAQAQAGGSTSGLNGVGGKQGTGMEEMGSAAMRFGEGVVEGNPLEALQALAHMAAAPVSSSVELYQSRQVLAAQQLFAQQAGPYLKEMHDAMGGVARAMRDLSGITDDLGRMPINNDAIRKLLDQKAAVGDDLMGRLQSAMDATDDPDEQTRLQGMMDDVKGWQADCQNRLVQDRKEAGDLDGRVSQLSTLARTQANQLSKISDMATDAAGSVASNPLMDYIQNARPENAVFAAQLRNVLVQMRANFGRIIAS